MLTTNHAPKTLVITLASALLLQGCAMSAAQIKNKGLEFIHGKHINLIEKNYAAADYLVQQAGNNLKHDQLIKAIKLIDADAPQLSSDIASITTEQIGQRFVQLGYRVDISEVADKSDTSFAQSPEQYNAPDNIVGGTYTHDDDSFTIHLRMTKVKTGNVFATYSYTMPMTKQIRDLAEPKAQIMSIDSNWDQ